MPDDMKHPPIPPHVRDRMARMVSALPTDGDIRFKVRLAIRHAYSDGYDDGMRDGVRETRDDEFDTRRAEEKEVGDA